MPPHSQLCGQINSMFSPCIQALSVQFVELCLCQGPTCALPPTPCMRPQLPTRCCRPHCTLRPAVCPNFQPCTWPGLETKTELETQLPRVSKPSKPPTRQVRLPSRSPRKTGLAPLKWLIKGRSSQGGLITAPNHPTRCGAAPTTLPSLWSLGALAGDPRAGGCSGPPRQAPSPATQARERCVHQLSLPVE